MAGIRKLEVTPGIVWVEVPEADFRLLCGCPADSVKHLMRRGLIAPTEVNGVRAETGPNAILLSDVMIQNGTFCNLAEFPVLQMFYRQGMLLPKHPNNTGARPLIIGRREQVQAQMQYIYRGNYGLVSEEEIRAAGVDGETAREMMRVKLRFAFGRIQNPRELFEVHQLEDEPVVARGVQIRRLALNRFEVSWQGESVEVDLNLPPFEIHECPYPLGYHQVPREYFAVVHSGDGDGWDIRRPSMGAVLVYQGRIFLIDAGPNLIYSLTALGIGVNEIEGIFHTHSHDDHFAGLTTLIRADRRIKYFAVPPVRHAVTKKLSALLSIEEEDFSDYFAVHDLVLGEWNDIDGLEVRPVFSPHPVETSVFKFRVLAEDGWRSYTHLADAIGLSVLKSMVVEGDAPGVSQALYDQVVAEYAEPADVKKVDIGGGLIHGNADDFRNDASSRLILAHTALKLTDAQKAIGSGASFGAVDVLVPAKRDFARRTAWMHLADYLPGVPEAHLQILMNCPIEHFNPETNILREGSPHDSIHLVLAGQVESLSLDTRVRSVLSAGALLGELTALHGLPASETCRAISFVQTLRISADFYRRFVERHELFADIARLMEIREFLSRTWLFGEVVSTGTLNRIAKALEPIRVGVDEKVAIAAGTVGVLLQGCIERQIGGRMVEDLHPGDFFGEETAMFGTPPVSVLVGAAPTVVYAVPADLLADIPGVRWKLFETFLKRMRLLAVGEQGTADFGWRPEYSVNIERIDNHHRRLFAMANRVLAALQAGSPQGEVSEGLGFLIDYSRYHFAEEEKLLFTYGYPEAAHHAAHHHRLMQEVAAMADRLAKGEEIDRGELLSFLDGWIVNHVIVDDRRYSQFLNDRGVY
ncbi:MAG: bacteriohemerythrin [Actinomycetota bacterium]